MQEIKVTQTYNIDVARKVTVSGRKFTFQYGNDWFTSLISKAEANNITVKMLDDGATKATVGLTVYVNIERAFDDTEAARGSVSFPLELDNVKISDLKGSFIGKAERNVDTNLDIEFNSQVPRYIQEKLVKDIIRIIGTIAFEIDIEQTVGKIEYIEK